MGNAKKGCACLFVVVVVLLAAFSLLDHAHPPRAFVQIFLDSYPQALCLDGSPGMYYLSLVHRNSPNKTKWFISYDGGGQCSIDVAADTKNCPFDHCLTRSGGYLGSSKDVPIPANDEPYFAGSARDNLNFHDWNLVRVHYCDGFHFVGNAGRIDLKSDKPELNGTFYMSGKLKKNLREFFG